MKAALKKTHFVHSLVKCHQKCSKHSINQSRMCSNTFLNAHHFSFLLLYYLLKQFLHLIKLFILFGKIDEIRTISFTFMNIYEQYSALNNSLTKGKILYLKKSVCLSSVLFGFLWLKGQHSCGYLVVLRVSTHKNLCAQKIFWPLWCVWSLLQTTQLCWANGKASALIVFSRSLLAVRVCHTLFSQKPKFYKNLKETPRYSGIQWSWVMEGRLLWISINRTDKAWAVPTLDTEDSLGSSVY